MLTEVGLAKRRGPPRRRHRGLAALWQIAVTISPYRSLVVLVCLLVAGIAEGVGIASLLPLVALMDSGNSPSNSLSRTILAGLEGLHLPPDPRILLSILVCGLIAKAGLVLVAMRQVGYAVTDVSARLRLDLVNGLLAARWGFFVRQPLGRFSTALSGESSKAGDAYNAVAQFTSHSIQAIVYVGIAAWVSWELAVLALLVGLFMVLSLNRLLITARRNAKRQTNRMKQMVKRLSDVLIAIKPMKAMGRQAQFGLLFQKDVRVINDALRRQILSRYANRLLQEPIVAICLAGSVYAAVTFWGMPVADLLLMALLMSQTVSRIGKAQQELQSARIAEASFWSVREVCEDAGAAREEMRGGVAPTFDVGASFQDVSFSYGKKPVIINASFPVRAGKVTTVTGPSGVGKTTLADLLLGLHRPTAGEVFIDDVPLAKIDLLRWRNMTGYVPQEVMLFHDTVAVNVSLGEPEFTRDDVEQALQQAGCWDFVSQLPEGMDTIVGERGSGLSGGQRQRIALARALIHKPKLLILDEATSALDPLTEATIVRNICELSRQTGLTVLSISHQPIWVANADIVLEIEEGHVLEKPSARAIAAE